MKYQTLQNIILRYESESNKYSSNTRILGVLEGILLAKGKIFVDVPFDYKVIHTKGKLIFGQSYTRTRVQTYPEFIIEKSKELLKELKPNK